MVLGYEEQGAEFFEVMDRVGFVRNEIADVAE